MTLALGAALSTNAMTPNLLFIYKDKETTERMRRLNRGIFTVFCCLLALLIGFSIWQGRSIEGKRAMLMRLQNSLKKYNLLVNQEAGRERTSRAGDEMISSKGYARRYLALAVMGELARITPKDRKSTRLNSSHGYISYAVFCLKNNNAHSSVRRIEAALHTSAPHLHR